MPRLPRVHLQDVAYYITLDGPQNESIFKDVSDYKKYGEMLAQSKQEFKFKLFAYALFSNRLELLIEANEEFPISQIMQKITPSYTKYYNHRYQRKGPLFQKRFRSVILEKETFLLPLTRFVHLAPSRFLLDDQLTKLPYTSLGSYVTRLLDGTNRLSVGIASEVNEVKSKISNGESYEQYMNAPDKEEFVYLGKKLSRATILGSEHFIEDVRSRIKETSHKEIAIDESPVGVAAMMPAVPWYALSLSSAAVASVVCIALFSAQTFKGIPVSEPLPQKIEPEAVKLAEPVVSKSAFEIVTGESVRAGDLNGTIWEVELISVAPDGTQTPVRDKITFSGRSFESHYFASHGFSKSNYSINVDENGMMTWETMQRNEKGEVISWRGDWNGKRMEGMMNYQPQGQTAQNFSFASNQFMVQQ